VKAITGGDTITARSLHRNPITFRPSHTVWLQTNHRPRVPDDSEAIWRRIVLVLFGVTIPEAERDQGMKEKLWAEADAILSWAVAGCIEYQSIGLDAPAIVRNATEKYRGDEDSFGAWLAECTEPSTDGERAGNLGKSYTAWAVEHGAGRLSAVALAERLEGHGYTRRRAKVGTVWDGLRLVSSSSEGLL
jgi:putative DNA primase/helicase